MSNGPVSAPHGPDPGFDGFVHAGLWPGLTPRYARGLPAAGIHTREQVNVERLGALPGITPAKASRLMSGFVANSQAMQLVDILVDLRLPLRIAARAVDALGHDVVRALGDDPWSLLGLPGVDPDTADRVARAVVPGVSKADQRRGRALVSFVLAEQARSGHTVTPIADVLGALREFGVTDPAAAVTAAVAAQLVVNVGADGLSPALFAAAEDAIARHLSRLIAAARPTRFAADRPATTRLDQTQRSAVAAAMRCGVSVLTGGPGTGKSATVAAIVDQCDHAGITLALAAPTGRAAKRLEELTGAPATTVHRLLGAQPRARPDDDTGSAPTGARRRAGWSTVEFERNDRWPLDEQLVVVDEASMLDTELGAALLAACADGTSLVVVGDPAQLPSVGPGQVLADLLAAVAGRDDIPTTELRTLYRQAEGGAIARLATAVRSGSLPPVEASADREVVLVPARGSADAAHRVVQLVTDSIPRALGIPAAAVQVVTPVHGGPAGTVALNSALKAVLNPAASSGTRFDTGDRVVATANHPEAEPFGYANGEVGVVSGVQGGTVTVEFSSGAARIRGKALNDLSHGWAVTVHRAQGSEFQAVVVVLPPEAIRMLSRPLVYTAITRAQRHLSVVQAAGPAVTRAVERIGHQRRRTGLAARLIEALSP